MIKIGEYQTLTVKRYTPQGLYLSDDEGSEVLLPKVFATPEMREDDKVEVFVYPDSGDKYVATTEKPFVTANKFGFVRVTDVNAVGAFCDWGVSKELLVPYRNQKTELHRGEGAVVYMYVDERSNRLVGTTKFGRYLVQIADESIKRGQKVDILIYSIADLGYNVIINQTYAGLIYKNEAARTLKIGQQLEAYIKPLREDGKIDVSLHPIGHLSIEPNAQMILDKLKENGGKLALTDKSDPDLIRQELGISKKLFKKSLGALYRQKLVILNPDGVELV